MEHTGKQLDIRALRSGGVITNYFCSSRCGHCLYACSPNWKKEYLDPGSAARLFAKIKELGCHSVHIGGGEPFLDFQGLEKVLQSARETGMGIDYIETNSSWFKDEQQAVAMLERLGALGIRTLLISISPFHNEYIPFYKVKGVTAACSRAGISIFPWVSDFLPDIESFPDRAPHSLAEYEQKYGPGYLKNLPSRYWISLGGRALKTFKNIFKEKSVEDIVAFTGGCPELADVSHFHFDLFGNYVPGLCSGITIDYRDVGAPLAEADYPFITILYNRGAAGLYETAQKEHGFKARPYYISKCELCFDIRRFLVLEKKIGTREFGPEHFYEDLS